MTFRQRVAGVLLRQDPDIIMVGEIRGTGKTAKHGDSVGLDGAPPFFQPCILTMPPVPSPRPSGLGEPRSRIWPPVSLIGVVISPKRLVRQILWGTARPEHHYPRRPTGTGWVTTAKRKMNNCKRRPRLAGKVSGYPGTVAGWGIFELLRVDEGFARGLIHQHAPALGRSAIRADLRGGIGKNAYVMTGVPAKS